MLSVGVALTFLSFLLLLLPVVCGGFSTVLGGLLNWTLLPVSVPAVFPSLTITAAASSSTCLSMALPPLLVSVPVGVVVVLAVLFAWFGMPDFFANGRRAGLRGLVFV